MLLIDILIRRLVRIFRRGFFKPMATLWGLLAQSSDQKLKSCVVVLTVPAREDLQVQLELATQSESIFLFEYGETD